MALKLPGEILLPGESGPGRNLFDKIASKEKGPHSVQTGRRHPGVRRTAELALEIPPELPVSDATFASEAGNPKSDHLGPRFPICDAVESAIHIEASRSIKVWAADTCARRTISRPGFGFSRTDCFILLIRSKTGRSFKKVKIFLLGGAAPFMTPSPGPF
jgi:hypothetical protein